MVLGGQFVSRLNLNLRERRGFTYGARTSFDFRRMRGPFSVQVSVQTNATVEAIHEAVAEVAAIRGPQPITPDELSVGVAALTRGYARNFETADQVARAVMQLALYDLPDDYFVEFVPSLERVTPETATAAVARHLDPDLCRPSSSGTSTRSATLRPSDSANPRWWKQSGEIWSDHGDSG